MENNFTSYKNIIKIIQDSMEIHSRKYPKEKHQKHARKGISYSISQIKFSMPKSNRFEIYNTITNRISNISKVPLKSVNIDNISRFWSRNAKGLLTTGVEKGAKVIDTYFNQECKDNDVLVVVSYFNKKDMDNVYYDMFHYDSMLNPTGTTEVPLKDSLVDLDVTDDRYDSIAINVFRYISDSKRVLVDENVRRLVGDFGNIPLDKDFNFMHTRPFFIVVELHGNVDTNNLEFLDNLEKFIENNFGTDSGVEVNKKTRMLCSIKIKNLRSFKKFKIMGGIFFIKKFHSLYWCSIKYGLEAIETMSFCEDQYGKF